MRSISRAGLGLLVVAACAPIGCGTSTQSTVTFGAPAGSGAASSANRLDFIVDNNQASSAQHTNDTTITKVRSFVLLQAQNTANPTFSFQFTDFVPNSAGQPQFYASGDKQGYLQIPNTPPFYTIVAPGTAGTDAQGNPPPEPDNIQKQFGVFDPAIYSYTPPAQITVVDTVHHSAADRIGFDSFGLNAISADPSLQSQAKAIFIHLNLTISITASTSAIPVNTNLAPDTNTYQFDASVPGDGIRAPYKPQLQTGESHGEGQVDWTVAKQDGSAVSSGGIDKTTGLFTAPKEPGVYTIKATSRTQPDKFATTTITAQQATTTVSFKSAPR